MNNRDTEAAWRYHDGTKHPDGLLMDPGHVFDPKLQPLLFKIYTGLEPIPLPLDKSSQGVPALSAISTDADARCGEAVLDIGALARILYYSAGITKKIRYPHGEMLFRAAACTGALYHIELYVVCGDLPGLEAGVYHFGPHHMALSRLRWGDHRRVLVEASGNESHVAAAPAVLVYTDVFWRNACKYQAREYRHAFWDTGTILSNTLALASAHGLAARVVAGFVDDAVNRLLDLDPRREVAITLVPIGRSPLQVAGPSPHIDPLSLDTAPISAREKEFAVILDMHQASSFADPAEVKAWRGCALGRVRQAPSDQLIPLKPHKDDEMSQDSLESVIDRRGSARRFSRDGITFAQLSTILHRALQGIPADFVRPPRCRPLRRLPCGQQRGGPGLGLIPFPSGPPGPGATGGRAASPHGGPPWAGSSAGLRCQRGHLFSYRSAPCPGPPWEQRLPGSAARGEHRGGQGIPGGLRAAPTYRGYGPDLL